MPSTFEKEIDLALRAVPFVPFDLVMGTGLRYRVNSPDMLYMRETVLDHYPYGSDQRNLLRTNQLAAIELLGTPDQERA